jgi:hypothetical protein
LNVATQTCPKIANRQPQATPPPGTRPRRVRSKTRRTIADLTRAIELSPGDAHSFFSREREKTKQKGNVKALADLDRSLARAEGG